ANPSEAAKITSLLQDWREDWSRFLRHDLPRIVLLIVAAFLIIRILRSLTGRIAALRVRRLPSGIRVQQVQTLAGVINSVGTFVIFFFAVYWILTIMQVRVEPLLASAGIAGLAIGFGAQALVHDFINGFFILAEDQFNLGDTVRIAGVKGTVETMSLRRTVLRDDDGTLHMVPNSQITIVSNMTRDWAQVALRVSVAYAEPSDKIVALLQQVGAEMRHDPQYAEDIVADIQVPGIERVGNGEADYLMLVKTRPGTQYAVSRELRRRIKESFQKNNVQPGAPGRVYVVDQGTSTPG
ncbi:MAG TPA: mechanosensitive ion channel family protein, partial [Terriglobales bacterium]|nr:mechanosensitive ion channel family protein [Terriglobales bacterium]